MFGIKEGERLKLYKHTNGTCNASGPAIRALRERAGISQEQLAEAAGVNVRMYQKYEQGDRDISKAQLTTLLRICKALSCKLSDIVTDAETSELLAEYEK